MTAAEKFSELIKVYMILSGSDIKALGAISLKMIGCIQVIHDKLLQTTKMLTDGEALVAAEESIKQATDKCLSDADKVIDELMHSLLDIMYNSVVTHLKSIPESNRILIAARNLNDHTLRGKIKSLIRCLGGIDKLLGKDYHSTCRRILAGINEEA